MCIWDSYVYQKGVLCFLIHKSYVRSIKRYCFVRMYAAIPVQLEIFYSPVQWQVCTCNMDFYRQSIRLLLSVELIDDKSLLLLLLLLLLLSTLPTSQIIKCRTTDWVTNRSNELRPTNREMSLVSINADPKLWDLQWTEETQLGYSINGLRFELETSRMRSRVLTTLSLWMFVTPFVNMSVTFARRKIRSLR